MKWRHFLSKLEGLISERLWGVCPEPLEGLFMVRQAHHERNMVIELVLAKAVHIWDDIRLWSEPKAVLV